MNLTATRKLPSTVHKAKHKVRDYVLIHNFRRILMPHICSPQLTNLINLNNITIKALKYN